MEAAARAVRRGTMMRTLLANRGGGRLLTGAQIWTTRMKARRCWTGTTIGTKTAGMRMQVRAMHVAAVRVRLRECLRHAAKFGSDPVPRAAEQGSWVGDPSPPRNQD